MELTASEAAILERYLDKMHMAGGPRAGYLLRRRAIEAGVDPSLDLDAGLGGLVERGLLATSEGGELLYLTEEGATAITAL